MALPQQALERLTRAPAQTPGAYQNLLMLSGTIFGITLLIYLGVLFGYIPYFTSQLTDRNAKIEEFGKQFSETEQEELRTFYSQISNLKTVLANHAVATPLYRFLEEHTLQDIYFKSANVNAARGQLILEGVAKSVEDAASQVKVFENAPEVTKITLRGFSESAREGVQFGITLEFRPDMFREHFSSE